MQVALDYLKKRANDHWLVGCDRQQLNELAQQLYSDLTPLLHYGTPPKILLAEHEPVRFLAGFIAACAAGCPVFIGNPNWVKQEWQQVFELVQPDLILGYGDWELALRNYYPSPQPSIVNPQWIMIPTSGSSGKIRFAIHTWETLIASVQGFTEYFQLNQVNSLCVLPLYHVSGLMQFMRSFTTKGCLVIQPFKNIENSQKIKIKFDDFFISLVPTQLQRLLQNQLASWLSEFKTVLLGGAPAWDELLAEARRYKIPLALTYGMTETASQISTLKSEDFLNGCNNCGHTLPHAKVNIYSSTGELLGANQIGIITINSESLALGYYPNIFNNTDKFQLDDLGFLDQVGKLNIVGRSSHKIITGGENVYPDEVEAAIRSTQLVNDVCVIGVPDHHWGQVVTALYVPINSSSSMALQTGIASKLSKFKLPKYWIPLETLDRNSQGKVNYEYLHKIATSLLKSLA